MFGGGAETNALFASLGFTIAACTCGGLAEKKVAPKAKKELGPKTPLGPKAPPVQPKVARPKVDPIAPKPQPAPPAPSRPEPSHTPAPKPPVPSAKAKSTRPLRVALVVSEATEQRQCEGRFPEAAIRKLISTGAVDLVAFPENFRRCGPRKNVVATVRSIAEDLGIPVVAGIYCSDEDMQCAGYWNPSPERGETREHFYAKHATSNRLAFELNDYASVRDRLFTPIQLRGRRIGVQLCHDMFFGLVGARLVGSGADVLLDLTGSNVNLRKWTNVIAARSLEHDVPFLCTMANWEGESGAAAAIGLSLIHISEPTRPS